MSMAALPPDAQVSPPMASPSVSVLLPVYNGASTLDEALDSLVAQTLDDIEVVVVDDGSTDDTATCLARRTEANLRIVSTPHVGLLPALNLGLQACSAPFVARMDADDICRPTRLRQQLDVMLADDGIGVCGTQVEVFPARDVAEGFRIYVEWQNALVTHDDIAREIFIESPIAHPSAMLRTDELREMGGYVENGWAEDYDLWLRYHQAGRRFAKVAEPLVRWREHADRATRTDGRYSVENFLRAKAHYLCDGPLKQRTGLVVWGSGQTGRRLSKHLIRGGCRPDVFVDIAPKRIGSTLRDVPIIGPDDLSRAWGKLDNPILLAAVGSRGARQLIRDRLSDMGWREGHEFLCAA